MLPCLTATRISCWTRVYRINHLYECKNLQLLIIIIDADTEQINKVEQNHIASICTGIEKRHYWRKKSTGLLRWLERARAQKKRRKKHSIKFINTDDRTQLVEHFTKHTGFISRCLFLARKRAAYGLSPGIIRIYAKDIKFFFPHSRSALHFPIINTC